MWNDEQREKGRIRIAERAQIRKKAIQRAKTDNPHLSYHAIGGKSATDRSNTGDQSGQSEPINAPDRKDVELFTINRVACIARQLTLNKGEMHMWYFHEESGLAVDLNQVRLLRRDTLLGVEPMITFHFLNGGSKSIIFESDQQRQMVFDEITAKLGGSTRRG